MGKTAKFFILSDLIFNSLSFYMGQQPNISKLLQIQSAMWEGTIVSIVLESAVSSLGLQGHSSSSFMCRRDGGYLQSKPVLLQ